jgi:hypothetical protein
MSLTNINARSGQIARAEQTAGGVDHNIRRSPQKTVLEIICGEDEDIFLKYAQFAPSWCSALRILRMAQARRP